MLYRVSADIVVMIHFLWILFLAFGAFLGIYKKYLKVIHISGLIFAFIIQIFDWYCPLTYLEVWLRHKHDPALSYDGSFIINYIEKLVYLQISQTTLFILTILLIGINVLVYVKKK